MHTPHLESKQFYLWLLLTCVKGATSFGDLTFDGIPYSTFREGCIAHGLLEDDQEWLAPLLERGKAHADRFSTAILMCYHPA